MKITERGSSLVVSDVSAGDDIRIRFEMELEGAAGPLDLTGRVFTAQVRSKPYSADILATFGVEMPAPATGVVSLVLEPVVRLLVKIGATSSVAVLMATAVTVAGQLLQKKPVVVTGSAKRIIASSALLMGKSHEFATRDGQPAIVFRTNNGVFAYSEICTHQGCTVAYSAPEKTLICPCHGGSFDPFNGAAVLTGPPQFPLPKVSVVDQGGWILEA